MNRDLRKHIFIRAIIGMLPIGILAISVFSTDRQSGNNGIGINSPLFLALTMLLLFGIFMTIEMFKFFICGKTKYAISNIGMILFIGSCYIVTAYLNHSMN